MALAGAAGRRACGNPGNRPALPPSDGATGRGSGGGADACALSGRAARAERPACRASRRGADQHRRRHRPRPRGHASRPRRQPRRARRGPAGCADLRRRRLRRPHCHGLARHRRTGRNRPGDPRAAEPREPRRAEGAGAGRRALPRWVSSRRTRLPRSWQPPCARTRTATPRSSGGSEAWRRGEGHLPGTELSPRARGSPPWPSPRAAPPAARPRAARRPPATPRPGPRTPRGRARNG